MTGTPLSPPAKVQATVRSPVDLFGKPDDPLKHAVDDEHAKTQHAPPPPPPMRRDEQTEAPPSAAPMETEAPAPATAPIEPQPMEEDAAPAPAPTAAAADATAVPLVVGDIIHGAILRTGAPGGGFVVDLGSGREGTLKYNHCVTQLVLNPGDQVHVAVLEIGGRSTDQTAIFLSTRCIDQTTGRSTASCPGERLQSDWGGSTEGIRARASGGSYAGGRVVLEAEVNKGREGGDRFTAAELGAVFVTMDSKPAKSKIVAGLRCVTRDGQELRGVAKIRIYLLERRAAAARAAAPAPAEQAPLEATAADAAPAPAEKRPLGAVNHLDVKKNGENVWTRCASSSSAAIVLGLSHQVIDGIVENPEHAKWYNVEIEKVTAATLEREGVRADPYNLIAGDTVKVDGRNGTLISLSTSSFWRVRLEIQLDINVNGQRVKEMVVLGRVLSPPPSKASDSDDDDDDDAPEDGDSRREADRTFKLPAQLVREILPPHDNEDSQRLQEIAARHHADARDNAPPLRATTERTRAKELAANETAQRNGTARAASLEWLAELARAHAHHGRPIGRGRGAGH